MHALLPMLHDTAAVVLVTVTIRYYLLAHDIKENGLLDSWSAGVLGGVCTCVCCSGALTPHCTFEGV
jgi:hypothetical protein